jgi:pSer/pThr/pTyr-binding forkhead associated (FHA) protein
MRGRLVDLREGSALVGSTSECDVMVCSDHMSRRHALVTNFDKHTYVEDLESSNGTIVNGQRCTGRTELHDGDTIAFADVAARYEVLTTGSEETTADQYLIEQRDSFAIDIASTKSKARFAIWTGGALAVAGFLVIGVGAYRYSNGFTSLNGPSTEDQADSVFRSYTHFFFAGGAMFS